MLVYIVHRLKHLNLEGNHITEIPCKEVMESSKPALREGEEEGKKCSSQSVRLGD